MADGFTINSFASITVDTAGTAEQVNGGTAQQAHGVIFTAHSANAGNIFVGDSNVSSTRYAKLLDANDSVSFYFGDRFPQIELSSFWVDTSSDGDIVHIHWF